MFRIVHSLSPHGRGPPSPTRTTTAATAARTAPPFYTQYVTNDCGCASISTTDEADAFRFCCVVRAAPSSRPCAFLDVNPCMHGAKYDIASAKDGAPCKSLEHVLNRTSREAHPPSAPSLPLRLRKKLVTFAGRQPRLNSCQTTKFTEQFLLRRGFR